MKITKILLLTVITCAIIYSCKKDHSNANSNVYNGSKVTFQKRWNISQTSARPSIINNHANNNYAHRPAASDTNYTAIEFMLDSTYVIFYSDGNLQVGQYLATNDTTLILDSLGTITIKSLTASSFSFVVKPDSSSSSISFSATAASPYSFLSSADSAFITNIWVEDSAVISEYAPGTPGRVVIFSNDSTKEVDISWSAYGTDLGRYIYFNGLEAYNTSTWLWSNNTHQSFCYSNWDGRNITDCSYQSDSIVFSQQNTILQLKIQDSTGTTIVNEYLHKK